MNLNVAIVGCGLIGARRAREAVRAGDQVVACVDPVPERADAVIRETGGVSFASAADALTGSMPDVVVVATYNAAAAPIVTAALEAGCHVLCEKPLGISEEEARNLYETSCRADRLLKVGFNHRHHPAIARAQEIAASGGIGDVLTIRAAYGHGGRAGYEHEWRADRGRSGGGELLDQGVHLVDLARWFMGEFSEVYGMVQTAHWPIAPLEDNAYALLRTLDGRVATLHTSWTQWRNLFRFEVTGSAGYLAVEGLGGSYGPERLVVGTRGSIPPAETHWSHEGQDESWAAEWQELRAALIEGRQPIGNADDGYRATALIDAIYRSASMGATVTLDTSS